MIALLGSSEINTEFGPFQFSAWYDGRFEAYSILVGKVDGAVDVPVRIHSSCVTSHYFSGLSCDCREQMSLTQQFIQDCQLGIVIVLDQEAKGNGILATANYDRFRAGTISSTQVFERMGYTGDARDYATAAFILKHLQVQSIVLLSNSLRKQESLEAHGVVVSGRKSVVSDREDLADFYQGKQSVEGHKLR